MVTNDKELILLDFGSSYVVLCGDTERDVEMEAYRWIASQLKGLANPTLYQYLRKEKHLLEEVKEEAEEPAPASRLDVHDDRLVPSHQGVMGTQPMTHSPGLQRRG